MDTAKQVIYKETCETQCFCERSRPAICFTETNAWLVSWLRFSIIIDYNPKISKEIIYAWFCLVLKKGKALYYHLKEH